MKVSKLLLGKNAMSSNCVLSVDKMYLQKSVQYHSSDFVGQEEEDNLYEGIAVFRIVSLKQFIRTSKKFQEWIEKLAARTAVNISFNNEQKHTNDLIRKEKIVDFKNIRRKKE